MPNVYIHYFQCTNTLIGSITMTNVTSYDIFWSINCFIVSILSVSSHFIFKQILYYFQNSTEMMWIMSYITTFYFLNPPLIFTNSLLVLSYPTLITRIFNDLHTDPVSNVVKKLYVILPFRLNPVTVEIKKKYSFLLVHCILPHRQEVSTSSRSAEMTQPSLYATGIIFHDNDSTIRYSKTRHYKTCLPHFGNMSRKEDKNEVRFYILLVLFSVYFI